MIESDDHNNDLAMESAAVPVDTDAVSQVQGVSVRSETSEQEIAEAVEPKSHDVEPAEGKRRINWTRVTVYGVLPGLTLLLAMAAGFWKWQTSSARSSEIARAESVAAAKGSTIALLSYQPDTVDKSVAAAEDLLTTPFKESYAQLTRDVVIPGAKKDHVSVTVTVPTAASVSATPDRAVVLLFVNQSAAIGEKPPSSTASSIRVNLKKVGGRWLISGFDPV